MSDRLPKKRPKPQQPEEHNGRFYCPICGVELAAIQAPKCETPKPHKPLAGQLALPLKKP